MVLLLALALRLPGYGESVWIDELYTSDLFCGQPIVLFKTLYSDIHPPAYFLFIHVWNRVFGDGELWLRLPALLSGLFSICLAGHLASRYLGRGGGLMAALLLACSPVHIWYSQEARPYSTGVFLVLAALAGREAWSSNPKSKLFALGFGISLLGAVFLHYYLAVFAILFCVHALWTRGGAWRGIAGTSVLCLGLLGIYMTGKLYFSDVPTAKGYLRAFDLAELWKLGAEWFLSGKVLHPVGESGWLGGWLQAGLQVLAVPVFLRGLWRLARSGAGLLLAAMACLPLFLFSLQLAGLDQTYIERSALPSLPLFWMVMAAGLTGWRSAAARKITWSASGLAIGLVLAAYFSRGDAWTVYKPNPDWRTAAAWLGENLDSDKVQVMASDYVSPTALSYYDERIQEAKNFDTNTAKIEGLLSKASDLFGSEGFPGAAIQGFLKGQVQQYADYLEALRVGTLIEVHELAPMADPEIQALDADFLLVYGEPSTRAKAILSRPDVEVLRSRSFRSLTLYCLKSNP